MGYIEDGIESMESVSQDPKMRSLARVYGGLLVASTSAYLYFHSSFWPKDIGAGILLAESAGDLVSGKHHYFSTRACLYVKTSNF